MWSLGHSVHEIERSHSRVVIEETATTGAVWLFGGMALVVLALWASVHATDTADRRSGQLMIERMVLFWKLRTAYDAHTIDRVYTHHTRKGSGLYIRFKSGRKKQLSVSFDFISLEAFATALNAALYTHHES